MTPSHGSEPTLEDDRSAPGWKLTLHPEILGDQAIVIGANITGRDEAEAEIRKHVSEDGVLAPMTAKEVGASALLPGEIGRI